MRAQIVSVARIADTAGFWCLFKMANESQAELFCTPGEVPGIGTLDPVEMPRPLQHDEISLEDWRRKIRNMR